MYTTKWMLSLLVLTALILAACQPVMPVEEDSSTEAEMPADETMDTMVAEMFYTSHAGHERFGMIDLASGIGSDIGPLDTTEVTVARTEWFSGNGAVYGGDFYTILNKRLPMDATPDDAQGRLARVNMETGATELIGSVIPLNIEPIEIDHCGQAYGAGFSLSNDLGHLFGDTNLYHIDLEDASITLIGDTGIERIMDLSFDPDGILWATTGNVLYTLDMETGAPTVVAQITGVEDDLEIMGIGFTNDGTLFATTPFADGLYTIDLESGEVTEVGRSGFAFAHGGDIPITPLDDSCEEAAS